MARERTRFAWTWAGLLAGVVVTGVSFGPRPEADSGTRRGAPELQLAQLDPSSPGTPSVPGVSPPAGTTPVPGSTSPVLTDADAGVGGSGFVTPPPTLTSPDAGFGTPSLPETPRVIEPGVGGSGTTTVPSFPPVGGQDGGLGF